MKGGWETVWEKLCRGDSEAMLSAWEIVAHIVETSRGNHPHQLVPIRPKWWHFHIPDLLSFWTWINPKRSWVTGVSKQDRKELTVKVICWLHSANEIKSPLEGPSGQHIPVSASSREANGKNIFLGKRESIGTPTFSGGSERRSQWDSHEFLLPVLFSDQVPRGKKDLLRSKSHERIVSF